MEEGILLRTLCSSAIALPWRGRVGAHGDERHTNSVLRARRGGVAPEPPRMRLDQLTPRTRLASPPPAAGGELTRRRVSSLRSASPPFQGRVPRVRGAVVG